MGRYEVQGFDAFIEKVESLKNVKVPLYVLFSGSKDTDSGKSWCPDCVVALPVVLSEVEKVSSDINFLYVEVGPRNFWKDLNNPFRTDARVRIKSVPTLMKYGTSQKLEEAECANPSMVSMMFEDE